MKRSLFAIAALALLGLLLWQVVERAPMPPATNVAQAGADTDNQSGALAPAAVAPNSSDERLPAEPPSKLADALNAPTGTARDDVRIVSEVLTAFRTNFPREGNPVGTNAEITAVLTGQNRLKFAFIPASHPAINREGELVDRWGTPFIFHAQSGMEMEVRSAGPDKRAYNADDVVLAPPANGSLRL